MSALPPSAFPPAGQWSSAPASGVPSSTGPVPGPRRPWGLISTVVVLVVLFAASSTLAVVQRDRLADRSDRIAELQEQAADDAAELADLRRALEEAQSAGGADPTDPMGGMPGIPGLEDLLGPDGLSGLEDLFGEGGLADLFGGGGVDSLLGDIGDAPDVAPCLVDLPELPPVTGADVDEQITQTTRIVEQLRGHEFPDDLDVQLLDSEQVRAFLADLIDEDYPAAEADADRRILGLLQAVPTDIDLVQTQVDLLGDQVAGFYEPDTGRLVVRTDDPDSPLSATDLLVLAHELEHALVDAAVGLPPLSRFGDDEDAGAAALSVVEGSAVALQSQFQTTALDLSSLLADVDGILGSAGQLDDVPHFLAQSLTFPYIAGPTYVCGVYADGGWDAVDAAISEPPTTTHEIMFPDAAATVAVEVAQPDGPDGYDLVTRRTWGAAPLSWLFDAPGGDPAAGLDDSVGLVRDWAGGEVSLWTQGEDSAVALALSGDGLCQPLTQWWVAASGSGDRDPSTGDEQVVAQAASGHWGVVSCDGTDVRLGVGETADLARAAIG